MDMRPIAETGIWIATLTMGLRGLGLLVRPEFVHPLGSTEPMNPMSTATLGAAWLALTVMFAFAAMKETTEGYLPAAIALAILAVVRAYLMFVTGTVPWAIDHRLQGPSCRPQQVWPTLEAGQPNRWPKQAGF